ncbi:MAG: hypothetical protein GY861_19895 [bacterium]|nr:hypothetical protein [bacterium]
MSECLAFFIGYLTKVPALQSFCLAASFAILVDYLLQITMFFAIATLDEIRIRAKRYDIFPCFKSKAELPDKQGKRACSRFLSTTYYDFLMKTPVKIVILVIYVGLIGCAIAGFTQLNLGLDPRVAVIQHGSIDKVAIKPIIIST